MKNVLENSPAEPDSQKQPALVENKSLETMVAEITALIESWILK